MLSLKLQTVALKENYTIGKLYVNGIYFCDTLENPTRKLVDLNHDGDFDDAGEGKIYGNTAIPNGRYTIVMKHSDKFGKPMPYLLGVYGFTGIMIHPGNTTKDTQGCILVGYNKVVGQVLNSRLVGTMLIGLISAVISELGEEVVLEKV